MVDCHLPCRQYLTPSAASLPNIGAANFLAMGRLHGLLGIAEVTMCPQIGPQRPHIPLSCYVSRTVVLGSLVAARGQ